MLAPGRPDDPVQLIDVRDLAVWIMRMTGARQTGIYNTTGPDYILSMGAMLDICRVERMPSWRHVPVEDSTSGTGRPSTFGRSLELSSMRSIGSS